MGCIVVKYEAKLIELETRYPPQVESSSDSHGHKLMSAGLPHRDANTNSYRPTPRHCPREQKRVEIIGRRPRRVASDTATPNDTDTD